MSNSNMFKNMLNIVQCCKRNSLLYYVYLHSLSKLQHLHIVSRKWCILTAIYLEQQQNRERVVLLNIEAEVEISCKACLIESKTKCKIQATRKKKVSGYRRLKKYVKVDFSIGKIAKTFSYTGIEENFIFLSLSLTVCLFNVLSHVHWH